MLPLPGPGEALLLDAATGAWRIVPRSAITCEPVASMSVSAENLDEAIERVLDLIKE